MGGEIKEKMREVEKADALKICVEDSESVQREIIPSQINRYSASDV
jgi:hypothetical protein